MKFVNLFETRMFDADTGGGTGAGEGAGAGANEGAGVGNGEGEGSDAKLDKTYGQADVDSIVSKVKESAVEDAKKELMDNEEYKEYLAFKDSKKTAEEKNGEIITAKDNEIAELKGQVSELEALKTENALIKAGINPEMVKYAMLDVKTNNIDIEKEKDLKAYVEKSQFKLDANAKGSGYVDKGNRKSPEGAISTLNGVFASPND